MENNKKRKTKFIIITFVLLVIATIFVIIKLNNSPNKEEKELKSYLKEYNFENISLSEVECADNSINIRYDIDDYDNYIKDSFKLKKAVEEYIIKHDKTNYDVNVNIGWRSLPDGVEFANYNSHKDRMDTDIDISSSNGKLEFGYFCCPEFDLKDFENQRDLKILLLYGFKDFNNIDVLDNMKDLKYAGFRLWNEKDTIPEDLIKHFEESHPDCIVVVQ